MTTPAPNGPTASPSFRMARDSAPEHLQTERVYLCLENMYQLIFWHTSIPHFVTHFASHVSLQIFPGAMAI